MRKKRALLVFASTLAALALCETALRLSIFFGPNRVSAVSTADSLTEMERAEGYAAQLTTTPGTERQWFSEDPPPLPSSRSMGDLIISNTARGDIPSKAIIERIEIRKGP